MTNEILPFSPALAEAALDSLQDLFSIDPLHYQRQHREAIVAEMQRHRARLEAAAESGVKPRQSRVHQPPVPTTPINPADLGF